MSLFNLIHLAMLPALLGHTPEVARATAIDAHVVALEEAPYFACDKDGDCEKAREKTAELLVVWTSAESAGKTWLDGDGGASIGVMQINRRYLKHPALESFHASEDAVRGDRRLAMRVSLAWMRYLRTICKGEKPGLLAYASGNCFGNPVAKSKVSYRVGFLGLSY